MATRQGSRATQSVVRLFEAEHREPAGYGSWYQLAQIVWPRSLIQQPMPHEIYELTELRIRQVNRRGEDGWMRSRTGAIGPIGAVRSESTPATTGS